MYLSSLATTFCFPSFRQKKTAIPLGLQMKFNIFFIFCLPSIPHLYYTSIPKAISFFTKKTNTMFLQKMLLFRGLSLLLLLGGFSLALQGQCVLSANQSNTNGGNTVYGGPDCPNCTGSGSFTVLKLCDTHGSSVSLCGPETIAVDIDAFCSTAKAPISVYALNLNDNVPQGTEVDWPIDLYPPIHLRYEYDELQFQDPLFMKYSMPIQKWIYIDDITIQGREEYRFKLFAGVMPVDIAPLENLECQGTRNYSIPDMDVDVVHIPRDPHEEISWAAYNSKFIRSYLSVSPGDSNDPFDYYPLSEYGGTDEIFSSLVFTDNCDACVAPHHIASGELTLCVECSTCSSTPPSEEGSGNENFRLQANASENGLSPLSISPNPFSTYTQYQYFSKVETDIQVRLFSTDGVALLQEVQKVGVGENTYRLDTQAIPEGAYYLQVKTNTESYMKLIVKME